MHKYGFRRIGIVDAIPVAGTKPGTGTAAASLEIELGSVLEITVSGSSPPAGTLTLLRWFPPPQADVDSNINALGEWRRWREDAPIRIDAITGPCSFSGRYEHPDDSAEYWLLLGSDESYVGELATLFADAQCVYYRGRK